jgi:hypothetical protein
MLVDVIPYAIDIVVLFLAVATHQVRGGTSGRGNKQRGKCVIQAEAILNDGAGVLSGGYSASATGCGGGQVIDASSSSSPRLYLSCADGGRDFWRYQASLKIVWWLVFCSARHHIQVLNVLVSGSIAKKDACEVVIVQFGVMIANLLHAHSQTEQFEVAEVGFYSPSSFQWGDTSVGMDLSVM